MPRQLALYAIGIAVSLCIISVSAPLHRVNAACERKPAGDANCDGLVDVTDFELFRKEYTGQATTKEADFDGDGTVSIIDFEIWRNGFYATPQATPTSTPVSAVTATPTPTVTASRPTPTLFRAFSDSSYWNTQVPSNAPIDPKSAKMIAFIKATNPKPYIRFSGLNAAGDWGRPIYFSKATDPVYNVRCSGICPAEIKALRIPANASSDEPTSDAEMTVYDPVIGAVFGLWQAHKVNNTWSVVNSSMHYLNSNGLDGKWTEMPGRDSRNMGHRGAPASTIGIRIDEIEAGVIPHKLDLYITHTKNTHVFPYVGDEDGSTDPNAPPEGALIRIKPSVDLNSLNLRPAAKIIATSLQKYGAVIGDQTGSSMALKIENTIKEGRGDLWKDILADTDLQAIPIDNFEIIQLGYGCQGARCTPVEQQ